MEYTKEDLIRMRNKVIELEIIERRFWKFFSFLRLAAIGTGSGVAVSLCKYLDKSLDLETALTAGVSCLAATCLIGAEAYFINKEAEALNDEYLEYTAECPNEVLEAVDRHFGR